MSRPAGAGKRYAVQPSFLEIHRIFSPASLPAVPASAVCRHVGHSWASLLPVMQSIPAFSDVIVLSLSSPVGLLLESMGNRLELIGWKRMMRKPSQTKGCSES